MAVTRVVEGPPGWSRGSSLTTISEWHVGHGARSNASSTRSDPTWSWKPACVAGGVGLALAATYLLAPPMGTDLSAQVAHADFFREYGFVPIDMRWYGGTSQFGYSWLSPMIMAAIGVRPAGAVALVISAVVLGTLLTRTGARRPMIGATLGAFTFAGNLVSGRITYALGVAIGLITLLVLSTSWWKPLRYPLVAVLAAVTSATSPPAGAFLGLAGGAVVLAGSERLRARLLCGTVVVGGAALPIGVTALVASDGGVMNISEIDAGRAVITGLLVALVVRVPAVRAGALLSSAMVAGVYLIPSPVGLNATRLATMFSLPLVAAFGQWPGWMAYRVKNRVTNRVTRPVIGWFAPVASLVALTFWQPPVLLGDLYDAGNPTASREYFDPLVDELLQRDPTGRIEITPTRDYWEAAYVASEVPLARGWLRQIDLGRNELFFTGGSIDEDEYRKWLVDNGVAYVAVPDARLSWIGTTEVELIASRPSYLREVWSSEHWTLFEVLDSPSIVEGAELVEATGKAVTFDAASAGDILVRVTMSRWLVVTGPTVASLAEEGMWTIVRVTAPGRYTVSSGLNGL